MSTVNKRESVESKKKKLNQKQKLGKKFKALLIAALLTKGVISDGKVKAEEVDTTTNPELTFVIPEGVDYLLQEEDLPVGDIYFRDANGNLITNISKVETLTMNSKTYTYITAGTDTYVYEGTPDKLLEYDEKNRVQLPNQFEQHDLKATTSDLQVVGNENQEGVLVSNTGGNIAQTDNLFDENNNRLYLYNSAYLGEDLFIVSDYGKLYKFPSQYLGQDNAYISPIIDLMQEVENIGYNSDNVTYISIDAPTNQVFVDFPEESVVFDISSYLSQSNTTDIELNPTPTIDVIEGGDTTQGGETVTLVTAYMDEKQAELQNAIDQIDSYRTQREGYEEEAKSWNIKIDSAEKRQTYLAGKLEAGGLDDIDGKIAILNASLEAKEIEYQSWLDSEYQKEIDYQNLADDWYSEWEEAKEDKEISEAKLVEYTARLAEARTLYEDNESNKPVPADYILANEANPINANRRIEETFSSRGIEYVVSGLFGSEGRFPISFVLTIDTIEIESIDVRNEQHLTDVKNYYIKKGDYLLDISYFNARLDKRNARLIEDEADINEAYSERCYYLYLVDNVYGFNHIQIKNQFKEEIAAIEKAISYYQEYKQLTADIAYYNLQKNNLKILVDEAVAQWEYWKVERDRIQGEIDNYDYEQDPGNELIAMDKLWNGKRRFQEGDNKLVTKVNTGNSGTENYINAPYTLYIKYDANNLGQNYPAELKIEYDAGGGNIGTIGPVLANNFRFKETMKKELRSQADQMFASMKFEKLSHKGMDYWVRTREYDSKYSAYYRLDGNIRGDIGNQSAYDVMKYQAMAAIDDGYLTDYSNNYDPDGKLWNGKRSFQEGDKTLSTKVNGGDYGTENYITAPYTLYIQYGVDSTDNNYPAKLWVEYDAGDRVGVIGPVIANNYTYKNKVKGALNTEAKALFAAMPLTKTDYRYGTYWIRTLDSGKFVGYYKVAKDSIINGTSVYDIKEDLENLLKNIVGNWADNIDAQKREIEEVNEDIDSGEDIEKLNPTDIIEVDESLIAKIMLEYSKLAVFMELRLINWSSVDKIATGKTVFTDDKARNLQLMLMEFYTEYEKKVKFGGKIEISVEELSKMIVDLYKGMNEANLSITDMSGILMEININTFILIDSIVESELWQFTKGQKDGVKEAIYGKLNEYKELLTEGIDVAELTMSVVKAVLNFDDVAEAVWNNLGETGDIIKGIYNAGTELWENTSTYTKGKVLGLVTAGIALEVYDPIGKLKILDRLKSGTIELGAKMQKLVDKLQMQWKFYLLDFNFNFGTIDNASPEVQSYLKSLLLKQSFDDDDKGMLMYVSRKGDGISAKPGDRMEDVDGNLLGIVGPNGDKLPNSHYAGGELPLPDNLAKYSPLMMTPDGYPDFTPHLFKIDGEPGKVKFNEESGYFMQGNQTEDFDRADEMMGITKQFRTDNNLTWHHNQDGETMELVPQGLHNHVGHSGGCSVIKHSN